MAQKTLKGRDVYWRVDELAARARRVVEQLGKTPPDIGGAVAELSEIDIELRAGGFLLGLAGLFRRPNAQAVRTDVLPAANAVQTFADDVARLLHQKQFPAARDTATQLSDAAENLVARAAAVRKHKG
jgi:hypothetical protein